MDKVDDRDVRRPLINTLLEHVERGEKKEVVVIMDSKSISEQIKAIAWEIVPRVCDFLTQEMYGKSKEIVDTAETVLFKISEKSKAKEVLLVLLEQADSLTDDVKYTSLLRAIHKCLLLIPKKRGHSIAVALETMYAYVYALELPQDRLLEGEQRKLYEHDDQIWRINFLMKVLFYFLEPLAENITMHENDDKTQVKDIVEQRELIKYVIKMFTRPMSYIDMTYNGEKLKSDGRINGELFMGVMGKLQPDYLTLLRQLSHENFMILQRKEDLKKRQEDQELAGDIPDDMEDYDVEETHSDLGMSVLVYLAFGERLGMEVFPQVYTARYIFEFSLPYIRVLLVGPEQHSFITEKGIVLLRSTLDKVSDGSLGDDMLEWELLGQVVGDLINVMIHNENKDIRTSAVQILPLWLKKFNQKGRHKSFFFILVKESHSGLVGYAIQMLKNEIDAALQMDEPSDYFTGGNLWKILELVFSLPFGEKTDLLDQSDRIMAALNILRYIILRDKPSEDRTGVWAYMDKIENNFLQQLRKGLDISRAHYELELTKIKDGTSDLLKRDTVKKKGEPEVNINIAGENRPKVTPDQQKQVFQMALHTFDMMQSVLVRVNELIPQQRKAESQTKL